jgi:hypothetical protein
MNLKDGYQNLNLHIVLEDLNLVAKIASMYLKENGHQNQNKFINY